MSVIEVLQPTSLRLARVSVEQYHRMLEAGVLPEGAPIELLDGLLVHKDRSSRGEDSMSVGKRHAVAVNRLQRIAAMPALAGCHLRIQSPVSFPPSHEPEPDGAIVRGQDSDYLDRHPGATDLCCVLEVSDSSLEHDRTTKRSVYAAAGVSCLVIINLVDRRVEVHTAPSPAEARYDREEILAPADALTLDLPGGRLVVPVADLIP